MQTKKSVKIVTNLSQSSQKSNLSSFSLVPQSVQVLHSMHCQGYFLTLSNMFSVNCRQVG